MLLSSSKEMLEQQLGGKKEGLSIVPPSPLFLLGQSCCYDLQTIKILCVQHLFMFHYIDYEKVGKRQAN